MTNYRFNLGEFDVLMIQDLAMARPANGFLPSVPVDELNRVVRERGADPEALDWSFTPILVRSGEHNLLIDSGLGGERGNLIANLQEAGVGVGVGEIDTIIITHGHGDHVGGLVDAEGGLVFPNAHYVFQETEWNYWTGGEARPGAHAAAWNALKARPDLITLIADQPEVEILPGICAVAAPGHTIGQIALEFTSEGQKLLHIADVAHHWFQLAHPEWMPHFDYNQQQAVETRRAIFERAARTGSLVSAYHFSFPGVGRIHEQDGTFTWEQVGK